MTGFHAATPAGPRDGVGFVLHVKLVSYATPSRAILQMQRNLTERPCRSWDYDEVGCQRSDNRRR
jgi:hypothetical protein